MATPATDEDDWVKPDWRPRHPDYDDEFFTFYRANGMTLQELTDLAAENGYGPDDVCMDYGDCGSHAVDLWVRKREGDQR
jgi:hypothetical protein